MFRLAVGWWSLCCAIALQGRECGFISFGLEPYFREWQAQLQRIPAKTKDFKFITTAKSPNTCRATCIQAVL
jgi:hypothetical protein